MAAWTEAGPGYLVDVRRHLLVGRLDGGFGEPAAGGALSGGGHHLVA